MFEQTWFDENRQTIETELCAHCGLSGARHAVNYKRMKDGRPLRQGSCLECGGSPRALPMDKYLAQERKQAERLKINEFFALKKKRDLNA